MAIDTREIIETTNGPVDLTGLTNEEKLICAFLEHVDPDTYDGRWSHTCLIGQLESSFDRIIGFEHSTEFIADKYHLPVEKILTIYALAAHEENCGNIDNAMNMAREELGVTRF